MRSESRSVFGPCELTGAPGVHGRCAQRGVTGEGAEHERHAPELARISFGVEPSADMARSFSKVCA
jgi:hypothetical protein